MARERRTQLNRKEHGSLTDFMADPDVASMLAFQRGDYDAFQGLVERHTESLVSYFFFRSKQLGKEVRLIRRNLHAGNI